MLNESDLVFKQENEEKPDMALHKVGAFVIGQDVVEVGIYKNEFFELLSVSDISEAEIYDNLDVKLNFKNKETKEVLDVRVNEMLSAILLSNSKLIEVLSETPWVTIGTKYIDNNFVR